MNPQDKLNVNLLEEDDDEEMEDTQEGKFLTFILLEEEYGIEIRYVTEIIGIQSITEVPDMPAFVKGVINLRGKIIPVMDVRKRFGSDERAYDNRTCIIVINIGSQAMGLIVDRVSEVLDIPENHIEPTPDLKRKKGNRFIKGMGKVGDKVKLLLDSERLIYDDNDENFLQD